MSKAYTFLAINPGSTSTKLAIYENDLEIMSFSVSHPAEEIAKYEKIYDQLEWRREVIMAALAEHGADLSKVDAVIGRGGNMKPVRGGTYKVNREMLKDLQVGVMGQHASNMGGGLAYSIAEELGISEEAYVVDPVIVDEFEPLARFSGTPLIARKSKDHPLNQKAVARAAASEMDGVYEDYNFLVAHMGGGISVGVHKKGKIIDVNNCLNGDGPMSPERSGGIPFGSLMDLCFSGEYTKQELMKKLVGKGGLVAYLGTNDGREVVDRIQKGDAEAKLVYEAMAYQIAKEIGAGATVLKGKVDGIIFTGGLAYDKLLIQWLTERVGWIAPIKIFPGEKEMLALCCGVWRVLEGKEPIQEYPNIDK